MVLDNSVNSEGLGALSPSLSAGPLELCGPGQVPSLSALPLQKERVQLVGFVGQTSIAWPLESVWFARSWE